MNNATQLAQALSALLDACVKANTAAAQVLGIGLIDTNVMRDADIALAAVQEHKPLTDGPTEETISIAAEQWLAANAKYTQPQDMDAWLLTAYEAGARRFMESSRPNV